MSVEQSTRREFDWALLRIPESDTESASTSAEAYSSASHDGLTDAEWEIDSGAHERRISESADRAEEPACADPNSDRGNQPLNLAETSKKHTNIFSKIG